MITVDSITSELRFIAPNLAKKALADYAKDNDGSLDIILYKTKINNETGTLEVSLEYSRKDHRSYDWETLISKHIYGIARKGKTEIGIAIHEPFYSDLSTTIRDAEPEGPPDVEEIWKSTKMQYETEEQKKALKDKCKRARMPKVSMKAILAEHKARKEKKLQGNFTRRKNNGCAPGGRYVPKVDIRKFFKKNPPKKRKLDE